MSPLEKELSDVETSIPSSRSLPFVVTENLSKSDEVKEKNSVEIIPGATEEENLVDTEKASLAEISPVRLNPINVNNDSRIIDVRTILDKDLGRGDEEKYEDSYRKYQLRGKEGKVFVLTPEERKKIEGVVPDLTKRISNELNDNIKSSLQTEWSANSTIFSILSKALVLESIKYSAHIAEVVAIELSKEPAESRKLCELCFGVGITLSHLYIEMKRADPNVKLQIHGVDNSTESVATTAALLKVQDIPFIILKNPEDLSEVPNNFDGVVLIPQDAIEFLQKNTDKYDAIVSENGVSYFDNEKHKVALDEMIKHTKINGILGVAALNPNLVVDLDKFFLVRQILSGKNKYDEYVKKAERKENPYVVKNGKIVRAMTPEAGGQIELLRYLLLNNFPEFISYMGGLMKATKAAKTLSEEIESPVSFSENFLVKNKGLKPIDTDWNVKGAPCDVLSVKV